MRWVQAPHAAVLFFFPNEVNTHGPDQGRAPGTDTKGTCRGVHIRWVRCDGRFPHWVDDYCTEAERYTVIVYSTDAREATAPVGAVDWQFLADEGPGP